MRSAIIQSFKMVQKESKHQQKYVFIIIYRVLIWLCKAGKYVVMFYIYTYIYIYIVIARTNLDKF